MTLTNPQQQTLAWLKARLDQGTPFNEACDQLVTHLRQTYPHYNWVGIYMLEGDTLHLTSWDGPAATQHTVIPLDSGLCGYAASTGELANVADVNNDDRYLQCFLNTRSELVVPIKHDGQVYGEIDIDSDTVAAFKAEDEAFLTDLCKLLARQAAATGLEARAVTPQAG